MILFLEVDLSPFLYLRPQIEIEIDYSSVAPGSFLMITGGPQRNPQEMGWDMEPPPRP